MDTGQKKEVSVFRNGRSQAVRIPKEFEFDTDKVIISRDGAGIVHLEPKPRKSSMIEMLDRLKADGPIQDFPGDPGYDDLLSLDDIEL